jgi:hypothetical protein
MVIIRTVDQVGSGGTSSDFYAESTRFESRLGHQDILSEAFLGFLFPVGKCQNISFKQATAVSSNVISNSSFINQPTIRHYTV